MPPTVVRQIPFLNLFRQYQTIKGEVDSAMAAVIQQSAYIRGHFVEVFEKEFAQYCEVPFVIGVSSGTEALRLALLGCGVGPGDEVITVPNTFIATTEAITMTGATPRFVDVDPRTGGMNARLLEGAITPRSRAIIPVHLYGHPADMGPILEVGKARGLKIIGDAAQAHGALYQGKNIGQLGDAVCFSFYPGKNLGAYGDAGAVATQNSEIAKKVSLLQDHGRTKKYLHEVEGCNARLDGLQAAILSVKLRHLQAWNTTRRRYADLYRDLLSKNRSIGLPMEFPDHTSVYHLFVIQVDQRDRVQGLLKEKGIETGIHYPHPLHLQPAYRRLGFSEGAFPVSELLAQRILSLPLYPEMSEGDVRYVAESVVASVTRLE